MSWLSSSPGIYPAEARANQICEFISRQLFNKVSKKDLSLMLYGLIQYRRTGKTPKISHYANIRAYEQTNGLAQELFHYALFLQNVVDDVEASSNCQSIFHGCTPQQLKDCMDILNQKGYALLPASIMEDNLNTILENVAKIRFSPRGNDDWQLIHALESPPECNVADAYYPDLIGNTIIREIIEDKFLHSIAQNYLCADVNLLHSAMWYTFPGKTPCSSAAQQFHYDLDTLRWLKMFIFLSDVKLENGPHVYVESTHLPGSRPQNLLLRDYSRLDDREVMSAFPGRVRSAIVPSGSVLLADTRCFHKGTNPLSGHRLVLELTFSPSDLFFRQY